MFGLAASQSRRALRILLALAALAALSMVVAACGSDDDDSSGSSDSSSSSSGGGSASADNEPADLRLMLDWVPGPVHAGIYYAQNEGLFEKENLNVTITKPPSSTAPLTFTAAGKTDLAIAYEPDLMISTDATAGKVKGVFALATSPLASMWFGEGVEPKISALKGKTVGWFGIPYEIPMLDTALATAGMTQDDIKLVNAGFNTNPALLSGKVDATIGTFYNSEPVDHPDLPALTVDKVGVPTYDELVIIANTDKLENDEAYASAVKRFVQVLQKAQAVVRDDQDAALNAIKDVVKEKNVPEKTKVSLAAEAPHEGMDYGCFDLDLWQKFADYFYENKQMKKPVTAENLATNEYLNGC